MTVRVFAGTVLKAKLTVMGFGVLAILTCVAVAGCGLGSATSQPTHLPPSVTLSNTATTSGTTSASASPSPGPSASIKPTRSPTPSPAASPSVSSPTAAPQTGGGGTAGLQDGLLFVVGGAAILAGAGSIAYRRRLARHR